MAQIGGYRKKIHGEEFFSPRQKELFPGLKRDLNMEIEDAAKSDDPLEACMERRGYKPGKTQVFQEAISAKLTGDMFGKQEKLTGAEAMFQEQMQECLDKLKNKPKLKFGGTEREKIEKKAQANLQKRIQSGHKSAEIRYTELVNRSDAQILRDMDALGQSWLGRYSDIFEKQTEGRPDIVKSRWRKLMADNDLKLDVIKKDDVVWILPLEQWEIAKREGITPGVFVEYGNRIWEVTFVNKRDWAGTVSLARKTSSGAPESCSKVPISILRVVDKPVNKMIVGKEGQMTLFGAAPTGTEIYMKDSPISKELQHRFEQTTFYPYDMNIAFNDSVSARENEVIESLKKYGITEIPENIQTALNYYRKALYGWYVTKANQVPGPMITGPSKYNYKKLDKSLAREDKSYDSVQMSEGYITNLINSLIKGRKSAIQQTSHDEWKAKALITPKREFADKVFQSAYDKAHPNLKADYDNGVFVTSIKNKGKKFHKELIEEAIREGLDIDAKVEKDYPELFGKEKPKRETATSKLIDYEKAEKAKKEFIAKQEENERIVEEWKKEGRERREAEKKALKAEADESFNEMLKNQLQKKSKKTIPEQADFINPSQMTLFGRLKNDSLPPILGWVGGKTKLAGKIISMMPKHKVYVEPFLGGGSVFFKKPLADLNVINDLDKDLINFYKGVRNGGCEKIRACKIPKNRAEFNRAKESKEKDVCSYLGVNKVVWGANMRKESYINRKTPKKLMKLKLNCDRHKDKLKQAKIMNKDYRDVVKENDSKDTLVYMDPPYIVIDKRLYNHNEINPEEVAKLVKSMKGKAIVSYNNHPRVRKAFKGLNIHKVKTKYSIRTGTNKNVSELLITNF